MILVDTSVWIDYFNGKNTKKTNLLDSALDGGAVMIGDLIFLEILQGFRNDGDYNTAKRTLSSLDSVELFGNQMVEKCAQNYRFLRKRGITIRKTADLIIATFCIHSKTPLLYSDKDFDPFVKNLKLIEVT
ncbi:MAG: PIN domain nuclease [Pseudomonadota bacterium]